jgi:hypothetical protein
MTAIRKRQPMNEKSFWSDSEAACLKGVQRAYVEEGRNGQTVRHYYYKLLSAGLIRLDPKKSASAKNAYNFVSRILTRARMEDALPWSAVVDPGRRSFGHWSYDSLEQYARAEARSFYRLDLWRRQPRRLEVWVEKDAMADFVDSVVDDYRIPVYVAKGYGSATVIKNAADRYEDGEGWTLLYCGDFDPSGLDIERNLTDTLAEHGAFPEIVRVALTQEHTRALPEVAALPLKTGDSRTRGFVAQYGAEQKGYELDALPASQLRTLILLTVAEYLDLAAFNEALEIERTVRDAAAKYLRKAMEGFADRVLEHGLRGAPYRLGTLRTYFLDADEYDEEDDGESDAEVMDDEGQGEP